MEFNQDAKAAIERMVKAYGVKTKLALCEALGITASALANRQNRNAFPAEYVLKCALDTGASVRWLTYGHGDMFEQNLVTAPNTIVAPCKELVARKLYDRDTILLDKKLLPHDIKKTMIIIEGSATYLVTSNYSDIYDGKWFIDIDGNISVRNLIRAPNKKVIVSGGESTFECPINDLKVIAKVLMIFSTL
ncbi:TPA: phage repressor protein CI [Serratia liquefaciens]